MGKGNRNRINREAEPKQEVKKKIKHRRPLPRAAKRAIACTVCALLVLGILFGILATAGTFKRANVVVASQAGSYDLDQQTATYMLWDAAYYQAYQYYNSLDSTTQQQMNQSTFCLSMARSAVQDTLLSTFNGFEESLREYIAVSDYAAKNNITLSKEEKQTAREDMRSYIEYMASSTGYPLGSFINYYIGCNVKMKDIEKAAEIQAICQKVYAQEQEKLEGVVDADSKEEIIDKYAKDHPESFYLTDYLVASAVSAALKDKLTAEGMTVAKFKELLVRDGLDNGVAGENSVTTDYKTLFNKHATTLIDDSSAVRKAIEDALKDAQDKDAALAEVLGAQSMTAEEFDKDDAELNASLKSWLFDLSKGEKYKTEVIYTADTIYVAVITSEINGNKINAAVKKFTKESGESYNGDASFKENFYKTMLVELELYTKAEGETLYNGTEDAKVKAMIDEIKPLLEKLIPEVKSQAYLKQQEDTEKQIYGWKVGSFQEWFFKGTENLVSPVDVNAVKAFNEKKTVNGTETDTGNFNVYIIVEPMKRDVSPLVDGGYIKFSGEGHAEAAQKFLDSIKGLTGDDLSAKFSGYTTETGSKVTATPTVSESISKNSVTASSLSLWLFAENRAANETILVSVADDASTPSTDESCTYVAFYMSQKPTWKVQARNGYINEEIETWVSGMVVNYELKGLTFIKDKNPPEEEQVEA